MTDGETRSAGLVFGEAVEDFDRLRLRYPAALIDDVLSYSTAALAGTRALEVGAGTGKATADFASRGTPIFAIEPDEVMADVLVRHLSGLPNVEVARQTFEQFVPAERFGLLLSAEAWHWTDPQTRWQRASEALAGRGTLALFWNSERIADPVRRKVFTDTIAEITPSVSVPDFGIQPDRLWELWPGTEMRQQQGFCDLDARCYPAERTLSAEDYLAHTATRSQSRMLDEPLRERLFATLASRLTGEVATTISTVLFLARREPLQR